MTSVLVVDDDHSVRDLIKEILSDMKVDVFEAKDGVDAIEILSTRKIDILLTDLVMPNKNGIDLIMQAKKQYPGVRLIAISGGGGITGTIDYLPVAGLVGAVETLKKPFTPDDVRSIVKGK